MKIKRIKKQLTWKNLGIDQRKEVINQIAKIWPNLQFDFVGDRIFMKGYGGSDADFVEVGVESLFDLVVDCLHK